MNANIISGLMNCLSAIFSLLFAHIGVHFSLRDAGEWARRYGVSASLTDDALPKTVMTLREKEIFFFKEQNYAFVQSMIGEP
jgi:hypothetical protein